MTDCVAVNRGPVTSGIAVTDAKGESALQMSGLCVDLAGRRVLHDVDLSIDRGELAALVGPNGAGKTTLLRSILGLQRISGGRLHVDGRAPRPGRVPIGYVPQRHDFAWDFPSSVSGVVMTGLTGRLGLLRRPRRQHWEAVAEALERVRMIDLADRPVGQLSGGQRQRVLVARALALRPSVLLLDEPFTGLDMPAQDMLSTLFADLAHEDRAILMTTHDLLGALDSADRLVLLNETVIADGSAHDLVEDGSAWMRTFLVGEDSALLRMVSAVTA